MSSAEDTDLESGDARSVLDDEVVEQVSNAALETALQTAMATMPSLREALEPVRQPSADALQGELQKVCRRIISCSIPTNIDWDRLLGITN